MFTRHLFTTTAVLALGVAPFAATASPIRSDVSITVTTGVGGQDATPVVTSDFAEPGNVSITEGFGFENLATQNANGESEANAESRFGGDGDFELVTSSASLTQGETNNSGGARQYFLDYTLQGLQASFDHVTDQIDFDDFPIVALSNANNGPSNGPTPPPPPAPSNPLPDVGTVLNPVNPFSDSATDIIASSVTGASFEYFINVNGQNVFNTRADAMVSFEAGSVITGNGIFADTATLTGDFNRGFEFNIAPISGRFTFDDLTLDGDDIVVTSGLIARAYSHDGFIFDDFGDGCNEEVIDSDFSEDGCGFVRGNGVNSFFFDPVTISSLGFTDVPNNPDVVPLPAAGWLLIAGLGGLAAVGRRRKS